MTTQHDERAELMRHKPTVQTLMDLARKFRSAPGDQYDDAYKALQDEAYAALLAADSRAGGEVVGRVNMWLEEGHAQWGFTPDTAAWSQPENTDDAKSRRVRKSFVVYTRPAPAVPDAAEPARWALCPETDTPCSRCPTAGTPCEAAPQADELRAKGWVRFDCPVCGSDGAVAEPPQADAKQAAQIDWSNSETSQYALWKNPLFTLAESLQVADGAIAFRDKVITNLRQQLKDSKAAPQGEAAQLHTCSYYCDRPECIKAQRDELREALAKRDAALVACVEALKLAMHWAGPAMERDMRSPSNSQWMVEKTQAQEDSIYAAITHANQVLEGGGK